MTTNPARPKLTPLRRIVLLAGGGVLLGLLVTTISDVVPRSVDLVILIDDAGGSTAASRTTVTEGDAVVFEASSSRSAARGGRLSYHLSLHPGEHRVEFSSAGCPSTRQTFDPAESGQVTLRVRCFGAEGAPTDR